MTLEEAVRYQRWVRDGADAIKRLCRTATKGQSVEKDGDISPEIVRCVNSESLGALMAFNRAWSRMRGNG